METGMILSTALGLAAPEASGLLSSNLLHMGWALQGLPNTRCCTMLLGLPRASHKGWLRCISGGPSLPEHSTKAKEICGDSYSAQEATHTRGGAFVGRAGLKLHSVTVGQDATHGATRPYGRCHCSIHAGSYKCSQPSRAFIN